MNIYDISEHSGYSIATVSRVINGKGNVSDKARTKILAVIDELGYVPNAYARGLGSGSLQTIGLLCFDVADMYLAGVVSVLERELRAKGYHSILGCTGPKEEDKIETVEMMAAQNVDAMILIGSHFMLKNNDYIVNASKKIPIILLNGFVEGDNIYSITIDDYGILKEATRQLIANGHKNFLYLYDKETFSGRRKRDGYRDALKDAGIPKSHCRELFLPHSLEEAKATLKRSIPKKDFPTAILASEDLLAVAALKVLRAHGISVPKTAEVIGYNNSLLSECSIPELTSVDNKTEALCLLATSTLFGIFEHKSFPNQTTLTASINQRNSTK